MELLQKKVGNTYFNFTDILANSYEIEENPKELSKLQFTNNKRKKFVTTEDDVIITITFSPRDKATMVNYINNLKSGTYKYYSVKYQTTKEKSFIVEVDPFIIETFKDDNLVLEDFEVTFELGEEE